MIAEKLKLKVNLSDWFEIWRLLDIYDVEKRPRYLYAIVDNSTRVVKFGRSHNPSSRLKALKIGNAADLKLCAFCLEREDFNELMIHQQLDEFRVSGEWFHLNEHTQSVIDRIRLVAGI